MRLYSFVNAYLSPLQHGLQTAHCVSDMAAMVANLGTDYTTMVDTFYDWARNHKTIIICNGGNTQMLEDLYTRLIDVAHQFRLPLVKFYEDEQSLNNALTTVALLVPEWAYNATFMKPEFSTSPAAYEWNRAHLNTDPDMPTRMVFTDGSPEFHLISTIKSYRLA